MVSSTMPKRLSCWFFVCASGKGHFTYSPYLCLVPYIHVWCLIQNLFRLGIIYKQQSKFEDPLTCFDRILRNRPSPLAHADIWFQIGHVFEQQKDVSWIHFYFSPFNNLYESAHSYKRHLVWMCCWSQSRSCQSLTTTWLAVSSRWFFCPKSGPCNPISNEKSQGWCIVGFIYISTLHTWSINLTQIHQMLRVGTYLAGIIWQVRNTTRPMKHINRQSTSMVAILYFQINQFQDALDTYSCAIWINPYISEVWFDLGSLYESCNNQITNAIDAYACAYELDPNNLAISQRLQLLRNVQATGKQLLAALSPQDIHPTAYASSVVPPPGLSGPLLDCYCCNLWVIYFPCGPLLHMACTSPLLLYLCWKHGILLHSGCN